MIADNLQEIKQEIQNSCALVHRNPKELKLVAVTKFVDSMTAKQIVKAGILDCAENRVDKLLEKKQDLVKFPEIKWHLIGNLQRRKVKLIINEIDYFHALDSLKLAEEIQKRAEKEICCFLEVNISGEESKHGIPPEQVFPFVESVASYPKVKIIGLMTMAPQNASADELHALFSSLRALRDSVRDRGYSHAPCNELSMGMSRDFPIAIEEGATFIRIGTALFK